MTDVTFKVNGVDTTINVVLPETFYIRIDAATSLICNVKTTNDYTGAVTGLYDYVVVTVDDVDPVIMFWLGYQYGHIDTTPELDQAYDELITYNNLVVEPFLENTYIFDLEEVATPVFIPPADYIAPEDLIVEDPIIDPVPGDPDLVV